MSDNVIGDIVTNFQGLVAHVPDVVQPVIVAIAGAIPFIEGEGAAAIGIIGGLPPIVAATVAAAGNFLAVTLLVLLGAQVRDTVTSRRHAKTGGMATALKDQPSPRMQKFQRAFNRYGVPGVSLLGPLVLPTHFTAVALVSSGVTKGRVLLWQAIAIVLWTTLVTLIVTGAVHWTVG